MKYYVLVISGTGEGDDFWPFGAVYSSADKAKAAMNTWWEELDPGYPLVWNPSHIGDNRAIAEHPDGDTMWWILIHTVELDGPVEPAIKYEG